MNSGEPRNFADMSVEERATPMPLEEKQCIIASLTEQIEDLEKQVEKSQDWFNRMAASSMDKLTISMHELRKLRSEKDKMPKLRRRKAVLDNATTKRMICVENTFKRTKAELQEARGNLRRLEIKNAEMKAEIEACKLSAKESSTTNMQVTKREKKMSKRILALEKQMAKLQLEASMEKKKKSELENVLARIIHGRREAEAELKEEIKATSEVKALLIREQLLQETMEVEINKKMEELNLKIDTDFQHYEHDVCRLKKEISNAKAAARGAK